MYDMHPCFLAGGPWVISMCAFTVLLLKLVAQGKEKRLRGREKWILARGQEPRPPRESIRWDPRDK